MRGAAVYASEYKRFLCRQFLGCGYWLRSAIGNMMSYSRGGGNKHYGFGVFGKLQGSRISIFVIDERAVFLV